MKILSAIFCADGEGRFTDPATGKCWYNAHDRSLFRKQVADSLVIMGRKTWEVDGEAIMAISPKMRAVVLSSDAKNMEAQCQGRVEFANSITQALYLADINSRGDASAWVIGGSAVVREFMPFVSAVIASAPNNDMYLPFDEDAFSVCQMKTPTGAFKTVIGVRIAPVFFHDASENEKERSGVYSSIIS